MGSGPGTGMIAGARVLVTGASGYLGTRLCAALRARAVQVTTLGRTALGGDDRPVTAYSRAEVERALADSGFDALINLAAAGVHPADRDPRSLHEVNAMLCATLVDCLVGRVRGVVSVGSCAEYAPPSGIEPVREDAALEQRRPYGASKALGGLLALSAARAYALPLAHLRLFNVFGPGEAAHRLLPSIVRTLASGGVAALSAGTQVRDFIHVDDACDALLQSTEALLAGRLKSGVFNVCTGIGTSVRDFSLLAASALGADRSRLKFGAVPMRAEETAWLVGDSSLLSQAIGWRADAALRDRIADSARAERGAVGAVPQPRSTETSS